MSKNERAVVRPSNFITDDFVEDNAERIRKMAQIGCTDKEIAQIFSVGENALRNNFRTELSEARSHLRRALRKAQLESAINDRNTAMLIWLGKNYLGQKEPKGELEHSGGFTIEQVFFGKHDKKDTDS